VSSASSGQGTLHYVKEEKEEPQKIAISTENG
jgi:hypothetical protein